MVKLLLEHKAQHNAKVHRASLILYDDNLLQDRNQECTALHRAAREGHMSIVSMLIKAKDGDTIDGDPINPCDIDCRDKKGWTPLHYASTNGHGGIVTILLEGNATITHFMHCEV